MCPAQPSGGFSPFVELPCRRIFKNLFVEAIVSKYPIVSWDFFRGVWQENNFGTFLAEMLVMICIMKAAEVTPR